jgi:hypothetical protein
MGPEGLAVHQLQLLTGKHVPFPLGGTNRELATKVGRSFP